MTSVMLGLPVDASPWAIFEEIERRGFTITITRGRGHALRVVAVRKEGMAGHIHALETDTIQELALGLADSIARPPEPLTDEPRELHPAGPR